MTSWDVGCVLANWESFPDILDAPPSYTPQHSFGVEGTGCLGLICMAFRGRAVPFAGNHCRADQGMPITRPDGTRAMGRRIEMQRACLASPVRAWPVLVRYVGQGSNDVSLTVARYVQ